MWGGFTVNNATLNRFFSLHFFLPFLIAALSLVHLALLHKDGSNNPLGIDSKVDKIAFYPYYVIKDLFAFFCFLFFLVAPSVLIGFYALGWLYVKTPLLFYLVGSKVLVKLKMTKLGKKIKKLFSTPKAKFLCESFLMICIIIVTSFLFDNSAHIVYNGAHIGYELLHYSSSAANCANWEYVAPYVGDFSVEDWEQMSYEKVKSLVSSTAKVQSSAKNLILAAGDYSMAAREIMQTYPDLGEFR